MAATMPTSSAYLPSAHSSTVPRTSFLGAILAKSSFRPLLMPPKPNLRIRSQRVQVPREQRFMFEESEINGPDIWNKTWYPKAADHVTTEKVNAEKVAVSGKKRTQKLYRRHSGRPGGMTIETFDQLQTRIPERIIEHAVRGMLPKGRLGRELFTHLKVYKGPEHPHEAQKPIPLPIRDKRIQAQK